MTAKTTYLYVDHTLHAGGPVTAPALAAMSERHKAVLSPERTRPVSDPVQEALDMGAAGLVLALEVGWPGLPHLRTLGKAHKAGLKAYLYWPAEEAVETVPPLRMRSLYNHWVFITGTNAVLALTDRFFKKNPAQAPCCDNACAADPTPVADQSSQYTPSTHPSLDKFLDALVAQAAPVPFDLAAPPSAKTPLDGTGVYLRLDYWAKITSGGSYGHTCHVAQELARSTRRMTCLMANHYPLLDELGVAQVELPAPGLDGSEESLLRANDFYYPILKTTLQALKPEYIYERICLGNHLGARLSQELAIPYIVEYNGSEISMKRSFEGQGYQNETLYLKAEEAAFKQATIISVVSDAVRQSLEARGVPAEKISINPNGVDPGRYAPLPTDQRRAVRKELGFEQSHVVVGFTGTFGGWHGIDVLADSIPEICRQGPDIRFLLIGDGALKPMLDEKVAASGLTKRVICTGRVEQEEGARFLGACDICVSPHSSHMVDSRFFGSPTKIFEYMALGVGIVASDLEQIGLVLSPALTVDDFANGTPQAKDKRSVLCAPGDSAEFTRAVAALAANRKLAAALGTNARKAAQEIYSWEHHVERLWKFAAGQDGTVQDLQVAAKSRAVPPKKAPTKTTGETAECGGVTHLETGDAYKDQAQHQWDNNPCGSQYVKDAQWHTLEWYKEVERYRYDEYGPWMPKTMEFAQHAGQKLLEVGAGIGTDHSQFASNGAIVTDLDLAGGHLALAKENFELRGLSGDFRQGDAEHMPFEDNTFDVVYSNGVIHHIPDTRRVVEEMLRVLKPGGKAIIMVYAENSLHYWLCQVFRMGIREGLLKSNSMGGVMSRTVEMSDNDARPLVKVYTKASLKKMFRGFTDISICQRQITRPELPGLLGLIPLDLAGRLFGWNLVLKAQKPA